VSATSGSSLPGKKSETFDAVFVGLDAAALILALRLLREKKSVLIIDVESLQHSGVTYLPLHEKFITEIFGLKLPRLAPLEVTLAYDKKRQILRNHPDGDRFPLFKEFESLLEVPVEQVHEKFRGVRAQMKRIWKTRKKPGGDLTPIKELEREALVWALFECLPSKLLPDTQTLGKIRNFSQIFQGSPGELLKAAEKTFIGLGATILRVAEFPQFILQGLEIAEIVITPQRTLVAKEIILSESMERMRRQTKRESVLPALLPGQKLKEPPRVDGHFIHVEVDLGPNAVSSTVPKHVVIYERNQPPIEVRWLQQGSEGSRAQIRAGLSLLDGVRTPSQFQLIQMRMLRVFTSVYPFIENHIRAIHQMPMIPDSRVLGLSQKLMSGKGLGIEGGPKNLWVVSRESYPEFGHFGAWFAAMQVWAKLAQKIHQERLRAQREARKKERANPTLSS